MNYQCPYIPTTQLFIIHNHYPAQHGTWLQITFLSSEEGSWPSIALSEFQTHFQYLMQFQYKYCRLKHSGHLNPLRKYMSKTQYVTDKSHCKIKDTT